MKLYSYFRSGGAYRVRIALNLKGLKPEMAFVNLLKGEQKERAYGEVNPQKLIPALIDGNHTLQQSMAIMEYLEEAHPKTALLPGEPFARAYVRSLSQLIACDTSPLGNLSVGLYLKDTLKATPEQILAWRQHWFAAGLASFERMLGSENYSGAFCYGDAPGMADCCLVPQVYNAQRWEMDLTPYPRILAIHAACEELPAFIAAHPSRQADVI